jgi:hypothetical protein
MSGGIISSLRVVFLYTLSYRQQSSTTFRKWRLVSH